MADFKQYVTQIMENGNVMISEDVVAVIVSQAVAEVEGVDGMTSKPGADIVDLIGVKNWGKGMKIQIGEDNEIVIDCNLSVKYGYSVVDVAKAVQAAISSAVESTTGVPVTHVNVNVCDIARQ